MVRVIGVTTRRNVIARFVFLGIVLLLVGIRCKYPLITYDEGFANFNALRILQGETPYKDFWSAYPAGQAYALALVFKLWGASLQVSRAFDIAVRWVIVVAVFLLYRRVGARTGAYAAGGIAALIVARSALFSYAVFPALALSLLGILACLIYLDTRRLAWIAAAGLLLGGAALFRWDIAVYGTVAILITLAAYIRRNGKMRGRSAMAAPGGVFLAAAATIAVPVWAWWMLAGGVANVVNQAFVFPVFEMPQYRRLPYPSLGELAALMPGPQFAAKNGYISLMGLLGFYGVLAILLGAAAYLAAIGVKSRFFYTTKQTGLLPLATFGLLLFLQACNRFDMYHLMPAVLLATVLLVLFLEDQLAARSFRWRKARQLTVGVPLVLLLVYLSQSLTLASGFIQFAPYGCFSHLARSGCVEISAEEEQVADFLLANTGREEAIYVGNTRHDIVVANDVGLYFLADRPSATRYSELHPGVITTVPAQRQVIEGLENRHVNYLVLVEMPPAGEPNLSSVSSGVHLLDQHIRSAFNMVAAYGVYQVWRRN